MPSRCCPQGLVSPLCKTHSTRIRDAVVCHHHRRDLARTGYHVPKIYTRRHVCTFSLYTAPRRQLLEVMRTGTRPSDNRLRCYPLASSGFVETWPTLTTAKPYRQRVRLHQLRAVLPAVSHTSSAADSSTLRCSVRTILFSTASARALTSFFSCLSIHRYWFASAE